MKTSIGWLARSVAAIISLALFSNALPNAASADDSERNRIALEALSRLKGIDLEANPAVKAAVLRVLDSTKGTPQFVELVRDFKLQDQNPALLAFALKNVTNSAGVDAARWILETGGLDLLKQTLLGTNAPVAEKTATLLGNTAEKEVVPLLDPVVQNASLDFNLRKECVRALAKTSDGAARLLALAKEGKLPADLKLLAAGELSRVRWEEIRAEAAQVLPVPQSRNAEPLPPVSDLIQRKGDAKRGEEIFSRPAIGCINCHQVRGQGIDFGPNLSEIGTKLGKEALYEAILNPSSGISFGYEAWEILLENGDEAYGLVASETADELAVKTQNGIVTRFKKRDITKREQKKISIMPAGLEQAMTVQELVDLIEYLASLKKPSI